MIQPIYLKVLRKIHDGLADSSAVWAVTGSLGMALQGMPMTVNDIDIQTDRSGAYRRFAPFVTRMVPFSEAETICSHFGSLTMDGIRVVIMGDIQKRLEDGRWEEPVDPARFRQYVERDGMRIPVLSLEYEYRAYLRLGRREKAETIRRWLEGQKSWLMQKTPIFPAESMKKNDKKTGRMPRRFRRYSFIRSRRPKIFPLHGAATG